MKFSILITSYNKVKYLDECINSCLEQTYKDFEIILYDNFSTDGTNVILKKYLKKIKIFKKKRISKYPAINQIDLLIHAFKISRGSIICLLDGDDFFNIKKLNKLNKIFKHKTNINAVFDLPKIKYNEKYIKFKNKKKFQKNIWPSIIPTSSISIRRNLFKYLIEKKLLNNYKLIEIDFRINVLVINILKKYLITKDDFTIYRHVDNGIMSKINKFSKLWWTKRVQAHNYMKYIYSKHDMNYKNKIDYFLSKNFSNFY